MILYIQTNNAAIGAKHGDENITDADILNQISWIEGDDNNAQAGGYGRVWTTTKRIVDHITAPAL